MKVKLERLSICPCGFPALNDSIPLGTAYDIDLFNRESFTWTCGGCGKVQHDVTGVWAKSRGNGSPGFLPLSLFTETTWAS